jgi:hypothetical protein
MSVFEWLARVVMLVLAGMITLSIIGAIAAIPSGSLPEQIVVAERQPVPPQPAPPPPPVPPSPEPRPASEDARPQAAAGKQVAMAPAPPRKPDPADWLEAITMPFSRWSASRRLRP